MGNILDVPIKMGIKCIKCHCNYGCVYKTYKKYCISCNEHLDCQYICVSDVSGGLCASCLKLIKLEKEGKC